MWWVPVGMKTDGGILGPSDVVVDKNDMLNCKYIC